MLTEKQKKSRALTVIEKLKERYPEAQCSLEHTNPFHLLVSVRLAAQCTDARVNLVTPALFEAYPTPEAMAKAPVERIEEYVHSCGLYKTKARDISLMSKMLTEVYGGIVPDTMEELLKLPGVGRKSANLILGDVYGKPAIVTDTHCIRITNRLGLAQGNEPYKVEKQLWEIIPPQEGSDFCHRLVLFGRDVCTARSPKCENCPLRENCEVK